MREIKLKAWDKVNKRWVDHNQHLDETKVRASVNPPSILEINHPDWIYLQSTGLYDKNGVEIYDGYIIVGQFGYKEVVKIEEFNFITREDSCAGYGFKLDSCNLDDIKKYVEVIGNIYENPELLDKD